MTNRARVDDYFAACTQGSADDITSHFCEDAVIYDLNHRPVRGATEIGAFYVKVRDQWDGARWVIDTFIESESSAAGEWSMHGRTKGGDAFVVRGSEHYEFRDGKISQIRQYWRFDPERPGITLRDYPYSEDTRFSAEGK